MITATAHIGFTTNGPIGPPTKYAAAQSHEYPIVLHPPRKQYISPVPPSACIIVSPTNAYGSSCRSVTLPVVANRFAVVRYPCSSLPTIPGTK
ncbi:MAG: hypothetical protein FWD61_07685 [Phycisphaerales bacterium]|nr:hypothetical protein [Phycisphaerales bacterium]